LEDPLAALPEIIPVTDLRQDAAAVVKRVQASNQPLVITQRGRAAAVMLSVEAYERAAREREILELLLKGEQDIAAGKFYSLDEVMAEADKFLASETD
jgi:prevent-host-death family protein